VSIIAWLSLGLLAGFVAGKLSCGTGRGVLLEIAFGIVSAAAGEASCPTSWGMFLSQTLAHIG